MGGVSLETCWASYKYEIKLWYTVALCCIFFVDYTMMHGSTNIIVVLIGWIVVFITYIFYVPNFRESEASNLEKCTSSIYLHFRVEAQLALALSVCCLLLLRLDGTEPCRNDVTRKAVICSQHKAMWGQWVRDTAHSPMFSLPRGEKKINLEYSLQ